MLMHTANDVLKSAERLQLSLASILSYRSALWILAAGFVGCGGDGEPARSTEKYLTLGGSGAALTSTNAADSSAAGSSAAKEQSMRKWHETMSKKKLPNKGCYRAAQTSSEWQQVPCGTAPNIPLGPRRKTPSETVGNTSGDGSIGVSGTLTSVIGQFPRMVGVTGESDDVSNSFSLQINSNFFANTSANACGGASVPANCKAWQQFVLTNRFSASIFIQYWLTLFNNPCPGGWNNFDVKDERGNVVGNHCWRNSVNSSDVPLSSIAQLSSLTLVGTATAGGLDVVYLYSNNGEASATAQDSMLNLGQSWKFAEFNIFGSSDGKNAVFNSGSTIDVRMIVADGTTSSPRCAFDPTTGIPVSTTGETNSLTLIPASCCTAGGVYPQVDFTQSNVPGTIPHFCLLNDISPLIGI